VPPSSRYYSTRCARSAAEKGYVLLMFYFLDIFTDFCQTKYLNVYRTNLHEICRIGRTLAADERSEVIFQHMKLFFDPSKDVAVTTNFMGKIDLHFTRCSSSDIR